ncbi:ATP-dependent DNA helicase recQ [Xylaria intraflava]|nr:ATP-dependent DNA helicase recQ [Xylaria intraflava]
MPILSRLLRRATTAAITVFRPHYFAYRRKSTTTISGYGSGNELLGGLDVDQLLQARVKRAHSPDDDRDQRFKKRVDVKDSINDKYDAIASSILKQKFGYDTFRHEQAAAIRTLLRGENTLAVFPTGGGKSLCYQIPGLAFEELDAAGLTTRTSKTASIGAGITIVVSPLIALMKDQIDALVRRGISAACLDSSKTLEEQKSINASMREGKLRILYCSPERLNNEIFVESIKLVPGGIRLVAVDEAHCISEWGHSFRPDYLKVARFVTEIRAERVICLTATATPRIVEDVCMGFNIKECNVFRTPSYRPNLKLHAEVLNTVDDKLPMLLKFLEEHDGPTLVYCTAQKQAERLAGVLGRRGHSVAAFHAGLPTDVKTRTQDNFMAGRVRIIVATIAFGMGIDKADIRNILHYDVSSTIEEYSQQVGRAGRDGKPSFCTMYLCRDDFWVKETFVRGDLPSRRSLQRLLEDIFLHQPPVELYDGGEAIELGLYDLGQEHDVRVNPLSIILATIELRFGLIREIRPEYTSYRFEAHPDYHEKIGSDGSPEAKAILENARKAKKLYYVDPQVAVQGTSILRTDVIRKLKEFHDSGLIKLKISSVVNRYRILRPLPTTPEEVGEITDKLYAEMESRETDAMNRFTSVCDLLTGNECFARTLSEYFGMKLPGGKHKCGHCTHCLTGKPLVLPPKAAPALDAAGIQAVLDACDIRDDPRFLARVAFGMKSPRVTQLRLDRSRVFGSLEDHSFAALLAEFTKACELEGYRADNKFS